jgi:hypothetical protein
MATKDEVAARAARLVEALRRQREQGADYPLTVARLRALADPAGTDQEAAAALSRKPAVAGVVLAAKKDPGSPVALAEDAERFASSPLLLEYALGRLATADKPVHPVAKVAGQVEKDIRTGFQASLEERLASGTLPPGVGVHEVKGKRLLYLERFPPPPPPLPKKSPAAALAERLLADLHSGGETILTLADLAGHEVKPVLLKKAVAEEQFRSGAVVIPVSKSLTLVGPRSRREALLASDRLLLALLEARTTAKKPWATLRALADALPQTEQEGFLATQGRKIEAAALPQEVLVRPEGTARMLALKARVPPLLLLAETVLAALRRRDPGGEPLSLEALLRREAPEADPAEAARLARDKAFAKQVVLALPGNPSAPVGLPGDEERLARSAPLIEAALAAARTPDNQALPLGDVGKKVAAGVRESFRAAVEKRLEAGTLPPAVGVLTVKKKPHLFLLADLATAPPARRAEEVRSPMAAPAEALPTPPPPEAIDFAPAFAAAFVRLDRDRGGHNLVSLVDLRRAVPVERARFDAELNHLRRAGLYTLSGAEGRHGLGAEEREAGIVEHGNLLLYVSRREEG